MSKLATITEHTPSHKDDPSFTATAKIVGHGYTQEKALWSLVEQLEERAHAIRRSLAERLGGTV